LLLLFLQKEDGVDLTTREIQKVRQNDEETLYNIGYDCQRNNKDITKAFAWFYKAALENYVDAQYQVGYFYDEGLGVPQDYKLAMEWYQKAADNGNISAQYNVGCLYQNGLGVSQDDKLAME
jgi:TPR repeat protein